MRFKLDENLGPRAAQFFVESGHDVKTVIEEGLGGASDQRIIDMCVREQRCLVSLDLDFADALRFPPQTTAGIAVLRPTHPASLSLLARLIHNLLTVLERESIKGRLWIVEPARIRMHEPQPD